MHISVCCFDKHFRKIIYTSLLTILFRYPIGHPEIITSNFKDLNEYEGLVKCTVLPPRQLFHPVLPYRKDKLLFPLCRTCADEMNQNECHHSEKERQLTGTWVLLEVQEALRQGYTLIETFEVWHYAETREYDPQTKTGGLFSSFIDTWLKLKQEASGFPAWCKSDEDKTRYVKEYYEKEGIQLDYNNIKKNPGLRSLAKLMLNSFWGKFGQRPNMPKNKFFTQPDEFYRYMNDDSLEIQDIRLLPDEEAGMLVQYKKKDEFVEELCNTNVVIAAYTSCHARLKLYTYLETLQENVLYMDTCLLYTSPSPRD